MSGRLEAFCTTCGKSRGLKPKDRLYLDCQSCCNKKTNLNKLVSEEEAKKRLSKRQDGVELVSEWLGTNKPATFKDPKYGEWVVKQAGLVVTRGQSHPKRGMEIIVQKVTGKKHSEETKSKLAKLATGNTHTRGKKKTIEDVIRNSAAQQRVSVEEWQGFTTKGSKIARGAFKKRGLHLECFARHGFKCDCCSKGGSLNAHHLNSWKFFPEQRYSLDNLIALCATCHKEFHDIYGNGGKQPNTVEQYYQFKERRNDLCII